MQSISRLLSAILVLMFFSEAKSQDVVRCGTDELHEQRMQDEEYRSQFLEKTEAVDRFLADRIQNRMPICENELLIPVAVHFQDAGIDLACAIDMALDQVNRLNLDFNGTNTDINLWTDAQASTFPGIQNAESCIQFCLATLNHPAGFGLAEGDYAVTLDATTGDNDADWAGYMNFFVRDLGGGILGYSPLGGNGNGDGIACTLSSFSSISCGGNTVSPPYHLGRTMTHEVGHYLLLEHPWGGGGCASTDAVNDTPVTGNATYGCPDLGLVTCTDPVLWMSYMDYCDDLCLFMFSAGQVARMETYVNNSLQNLINNSVTTCQEAACLTYEVTSTYEDETCPGNDGRIDIEVIEGNPPYVYSITGGTSSQNTPSFLNLPSGDYEILVTDNSECEYTRSVTIEQDNAEIDLIASEPTWCGNDSGSVLVNVDVMSTFEYSIDGGLSWQDEPLFDNMSAGSYQVQVRNGSGCSGYTNVTVQNEDDLNIQVAEFRNANCPYAPNGKIELSMGGGEPPFEFSIDEETDILQTAIFSGLDIGEYTIYINDSRDCSSEYTFNIFENFSAFSDDCPCSVFIPTAITADGDGINDVLEVVASCPYANYSIEVFDRWGQVVFETIDPTRFWNGGLDEYYVNDGIYFYKVKFTWGAESGSSNVEEIVGSVMVIR